MWVFLIEEVNLEDPNLSLKSVHGQKSEEFSSTGDLPSPSINKDILYSSKQRIHIYDLLICN